MAVIVDVDVLKKVAKVIAGADAVAIVMTINEAGEATDEELVTVLNEAGEATDEEPLFKLNGVRKILFKLHNHGK